MIITPMPLKSSRNKKGKGAEMKNRRYPSNSKEAIAKNLFPIEAKAKTGSFRRVQFIVVSKPQFPFSSGCVMVRHALFGLWRGKRLHTISHEGPSESLKRKLAVLQRKKKIFNPKKHDVFVEVPESMEYLDTASTPMILTVVGVALFAKLLMMYDESRSQELIEKKIQNAPPDQGTVRMLTREEWEEIREVRPRTPFESKLARPSARIRTSDALKKVSLEFPFLQGVRHSDLLEIFGRKNIVIGKKTLRETQLPELASAIYQYEKSPAQLDI